MHQKNKQGENIFFSSKMDLSLRLNPGVDNDSRLSSVSLKSKLQREDLDAGGLFSNWTQERQVREQGKEKK